MKHLSRRDFIHAGCAAGAVSLLPSIVDRAEAGFLHRGTAPAAPTGHKAQINMNNLNGNSYGQEYPFIDVARQTVRPWTAIFAVGDYSSLLSSTGYPTAMPSSPYDNTWRTICNSYFTGSDPWVLVWDGTATVTADWQGFTVSINSINSNRIEYTVSGGTLYSSVFASLSISSITTAPTKISLYRKSHETDFLAGKITNPDFRPIYNIWGRIRFMDWMGTNNSPFTKWSQLATAANMSHCGMDLTMSQYVGLTTRSSGTNDFTASGAPAGSPSSWTEGQMIVLKMPQASCTSATNGVNPTFTTPTAHGFNIGDLVYFNNAVGGTWFTIENAINGQAPTYPITAVPSSTTFTIAGLDSTTFGTLLVAQAYILPTQVPLISCTTGSSTTTFVTAIPHNFSTGNVVTFPIGMSGGSTIEQLTNGDGTPSNAGQFFTVTVINSTTFTIPLNSTGFTYTPGAAFTASQSGSTLTVTAVSSGSIATGSFLSGSGVLANTIIVSQLTGSAGSTGTYSLSTQVTVSSTSCTSSSGTVAKQLRFACSGLSLKKVLSAGFQNFFAGSFGAFLCFQPMYLCYDADFDCLRYTPAPSENGSGQANTTPVAIMVQMCNELGLSPWLCIPPGFDDASVLSMATYTAANSVKPTNFELGNEVWGALLGRGNAPIVYAMIKGIHNWPTLAGEEAMNNWYGWRFYNMMAQVNSAYSGKMNQVVRQFAVWTSAVNSQTVTQRMQAASAGLPAYPVTRADELAIAPYYEWDRGSGPSAFAIYSIQQGNTAAGIADMDAMMTAPYAAYTANISGTSMTVTSVTSGTLTVGQSVQFYASTIGTNGYSGNCYITGQTGGTPGGAGTYTISPSQGTYTGMNCSATTWFNYGYCTQVLFPFWGSTASSAGLRMSCYEGGFGVIPSADNIPSSYLGNPLTLTDAVNAMIAYKTSTAYQTMLANVLASYKSQGGVYAAQYWRISGTPNANNAFSIVVGNLYNFTADPAYTSLLNYNAN